MWCDLCAYVPFSLFVHLMKRGQYSLSCSSLSRNSQRYVVEPSLLFRFADSCVVLLLRFSRFFGLRPFLRFMPEPTLSGESYDRSSAILLRLVLPMSITTRTKHTFQQQTATEIEAWRKRERGRENVRRKVRDQKCECCVNFFFRYFHCGNLLLLLP